MQSLRRLKLSGRLADDKIARLESIGFEWRLRQKEDGPGHEFRDGDQVDAYDDHSADSVDANSDDDFVATENDETTQTKSEDRVDRWRSYARDMWPTKDHQPQRVFAYYDGLRMEELTTTKSSTATTTTTKTATVTKASTTTTTMRNKKAKVRLPRSPTFSLNDLDETLHEKYGHAKYDYDDDDDEEFDAALDDDEEEDDDWEDGARSTSRTKRKRTKERPKGRHVSHDADKRPMSPLANKSGKLPACISYSLLVHAHHM